jgi:hypothetical protein
MAFAASDWSGLITSLIPGMSSGTKTLPPPTAISGRSPRAVLTLPIASASMPSKPPMARPSSAE